ncbi:hypothetical protein QR680_010296 [Steinernema hermaphroditum]|uniref:Uncharacterized protein n=1 Tax=Steinernema hermaphroditum TaxID=289476 RepID=A0AA39MBB2_9BILA|nr:hypothetical protein QR680_010296 [Steinernema hermaphroditum]
MGAAAIALVLLVSAGVKGLNIGAPVSIEGMPCIDKYCPQPGFLCNLNTTTCHKAPECVDIYGEKECNVVVILELCSPKPDAAPLDPYWMYDCAIVRLCIVRRRVISALNF